MFTKCMDLCLVEELRLTLIFSKEKEQTEYEKTLASGTDHK